MENSIDICPDFRYNRFEKTSKKKGKRTMKTVCVITGGGSGMGLEAAKCMPKEKILVISGRTLKKLEGAVEELKALGYEAYAKPCDTSNRDSVKELVSFSASLGEIKNVINSAGVSPAMKGTSSPRSRSRLKLLMTARSSGR